MTSTSAKNIHYAAVMIAALTISTLVFALDKIENYPHYRNCYKIFLPSENPGHPFNIDYIKDKLKKKKVFTFDIKGEEEDAFEIERMRDFATKLKYLCDSNKVINIHFDDNLSYGNLMKLFDITVYDQHLRWAYFNYDIYIFPYQPGYCDKLEPYPKNMSIDLSIKP